MQPLKYHVPLKFASSMNLFWLTDFDQLLDAEACKYYLAWAVVLPTFSTVA